MEHVAVFVDDSASCVDASLLAEAVDGVLRAPAAVHVAVTALGTGRTLEIRVGRGGRVAWSKRFDLVSADCPTAPEAIASSIRAGLADLPGWLRTGDAASSWGIDLPLTASLGVGAPLEARFGFGGRASVVLGTGRLLLGLAAEVGTPMTVGDGSAHTGAVAAELGWGMEPTGSAWILQGGVRAGPALSWGSGFVHDETGLSPEVALWFQGGHRATESLLISLGLRGNLVRVAPAYGPANGPETVIVPGPWVRLELGLVPRFRKKVSTS